MIRRRHPGRLRRWVRLAAICCVAVPALGLAVLAGLVWCTLPGGDLTADIPGLAARMTITVDADGIPRIRAASEADAARAIGFLHARERMLQMDLARRGAGGTLAELIGPLGLPIDRMTRLLGFRQAAEADLAVLTPGTRALLDAYAQGVNAWIARRGRFVAAEYLVLGPPRPWAAVDCLLLGKGLGLSLSGNWRQELARAALLDGLRPEQVLALWPTRGAPRPDALLIPDLPAVAAKLAAVLPRFPDPFTQPETASDEWAVDGAHSATGAPLLAGDPHLELNLPGVWYLARIEVPGRAMVGATAPGIPFLVIGQNGHIAWTFTNNGADVQDLFVETPSGPDAYLTPDGPRPYTIRTETIHVRGAPDVALRVRETRHGPVISDLLDPQGPVLAAAMANLMPGDTVADGLLSIDRAETLSEAEAAAPVFTSPVQNLLAADRNGIGLFVTGRVPIRRAGDGRLPAPGADGSHDWIGWASGAALPHTLAPASGRLVNGNEPVAPLDFPVWMGGDTYGDWRARRIRELLDATPHPDVADFARMQADIVSRFAADHLPRLRDVPAEALAAQARDLLRGWNGEMRRDAPQPLILAAWMDVFAGQILRRQGVTPPSAAAAPPFERIADALGPNAGFWCGGDCTPILADSLRRATTDLAARHGPDPATWRWGSVHRANFANRLLRFLPVIGPLTGASIEADGGDDTLLRAETFAPGFAAGHGAAYRGVYDLANPDRSRFLVAPGQSGHFASRLARNFLTRWRDGDTIAIGPEAAFPDVTITLRPTP